jgi:hypothetical protein
LVRRLMLSVAWCKLLPLAFPYTNDKKRLINLNTNRYFI